MTVTLSRPDFGKFEITSMAARKRKSTAFFSLCLATSTFSIVILAVLLSSIVIAALPVFGPHADTLQSQSRVVISQGSGASGDPDQLDPGDLIQGIFRPGKLIRGGLGNANDETLNDEPTGEHLIGVFSLEVTRRDDKVVSLQPARGRQGIAALLELAGITSPVPASDLEAAGIAVFRSDHANVEFDEIEIDGALMGEPFVGQVMAAGDWSVRLLAGPRQPDDFAEIQLGGANDGQMDKIRKTRVRKKAGYLKVLNSVLFERNHSQGEYEPQRLRPFSDESIVTGQLKVDDAELTGVSRRKKKGFDLGGDFNLIWCPVPEADASSFRHATHFLNEVPNTSQPPEAGIGPALWGSIWVCAFCALFALPLGIGTAIFLEEFKPTNRFLGLVQSLIQLNITNLAGVPSIVYGILGLTAFATMFSLFGSDKDPAVQFGAEHYYQYLSEGVSPILVPIDSPDEIPQLVDDLPANDGDYQPITLNVIGPDDDLPEDPELLQRTLRVDAQGGLISDKPWFYFQLPLGRGVLAASLTLMLVILPVIIIASQEAIRAVPPSLREGALGLGSTRWQVVRNVTLPAAIPGIMTGAILSLSRAIGEAAPIIVLCGTVFIAKAPTHLMDYYSVLPIQIFYLTGQPPNDEGLISFQNVAAASSLVLLAVLLTFNTVAVVLRQLTQKPLS